VRPALSQAASSPPPAEPPAQTAETSGFALRGAVALALVGLGITLWHFALPSPLAFTAFMIVGQGAFAVAMAIYLWVIIRDLRRRRAL
jgi:hypothetical protein